METALSRLNSFYTELHQIDSWLITVSEDLERIKKPCLELEDKVKTFEATQSLLKEIKSYDICLSKICAEAETILLPLETKAELKELKEKFETVTEKLKMESSLIESNIASLQHYKEKLEACQQWLCAMEELLSSLPLEEADKTGPGTRVSVLEKLKDSSPEGDNLLNSVCQIRELLLTSGIPPDKETLFQDLQQRWICYQHKLQTAVVTISSETTLNRSRSENSQNTETELLVEQNTEFPSIENHTADMEMKEASWEQNSEQFNALKVQINTELGNAEQKLNYLKNQDMKLSIDITSKQLREIENICEEIIGKKDMTLSHMAEATARLVVPSAMILEHTDYIESQWNKLLADISVIKDRKDQQLHLIKDYSEQMAVAKSLVQKLSVGQESIKLKSKTSQLEDIQRFISTMNKERDILNDLKHKQQALSECLNHMDKDLTTSQVNHIVQQWIQIEQSTENKHTRLLKDKNEFTYLMNKTEEVRKFIQSQQHVVSEASNLNQSSRKIKIMAHIIDLKTMKHDLYQVLKHSEVLTQGTLGEEEKNTLNDSVTDLQNQLFNLEKLAVTEKDKLTVSSVKTDKIIVAMHDSLLRVKEMNRELNADWKTSLFPDELRTQIKKHKEIQNDIFSRQATIESLAAGVNEILVDLDEQDQAKVCSHLQSLQVSYEALAADSTHRLQHLETLLPKREMFFTEIENVNSWLMRMQRLMFSEANTIIGTDDLEHELNVLKETLEESRQKEKLITSLLNESQGFSMEMNVSEQRLLNDELNGLENKVKRTLSLMEKKCQKAEEKLHAHQECLRKMNSLHQELNDVQQKLLDRQQSCTAGKDINVKYDVLKHKIATIHSDLQQVEKLKEMIESTGQSWDDEQLTELQTSFLKVNDLVEDNAKKFETFSFVHGSYQKSLKDLETLIDNIREEAEKMTTESYCPMTKLRTCQDLLQSVHAANDLYIEAINHLKNDEVFDPSVKETEEQQIRGLKENIGSLHQVLHKMLLDIESSSVKEDNFDSKLESTIQFLNQTKLLLQQPFQTDLEICAIQKEKQKYQALQEEIQAKICVLSSLKEEEIERLSKADSSLTANIKKKWQELEDLEGQCQKGFSVRVSVISDAYEATKKYNDALRSATDFLALFEASLIQQKTDLSRSRQAQQYCQNPYGKEDEYKSEISAIQDLLPQLEKISKPEVKHQLISTLSGLLVKNAILRGKAEMKKQDIIRRSEIYKSCKEFKCLVYKNLTALEKIFTESVSQTPVSYEEALEGLENSKILVSEINRVEGELMELREETSKLDSMCDNATFAEAVSALWGKWLELRDAAENFEINCEVLKNEWSTINEESERVTKILDKLQEEVPENPKEKATKAELLELLDYMSHYEDKLCTQQSTLTLLLHHAKSILNVEEKSETIQTTPLVQEIQAMQDRCENLKEKAKKSLRSVQTEIQEREAVEEEIMAIKISLEQAVSSLHSLSSSNPKEKQTQLEKLQSEISAQKATMKNITENLRIKYSEMYTIVPAEIEAQLEECTKTLKDVEGQLEEAGLQSQSTPQYVVNKKVEEINTGLQNLEKLLQQKSKTFIKANEVQKGIWEELDLWHLRLAELESEVQDLAEENPEQAQELVDSLMAPFQLHQKLSQFAEHRTALLNRVTGLQEEYDDLLKSTKDWIKNTERFLSVKAKYDSAKSISKHVDILRVAFEDSLQKQCVLHDFSSILEEFSMIYDTDVVVQQIKELDQQTTTLQQTIVTILPQVQQMAGDLDGIEAEVKMMGKKVVKIKAILSSNDLEDISPKEQISNREVILDNINSMKKTIEEINTYKTELRLRESEVSSLEVFKRTEKLLQQVKDLEDITIQQNAVLQLAIDQLAEHEQEVEELERAPEDQQDENLRGLPASPDSASERPQTVKSLEGQLTVLNQRKKAFLLQVENSLMALIEESDQEEAGLENQAFTFKQTEKPQHLAIRHEPKTQANRKGSISILPPLTEEAEEENILDSTTPEKWTSSEILCQPTEEEGQDSANSGKSWSSGTLTGSVQEDVEEQFSGTDEDHNEIPPWDTECDQGFHKPLPHNEMGEDWELQPLGLFWAYREQATKLELWLEKAKEVLERENKTAEMQQSVEQQLLTCQSMLLEIEQKVACLSEMARKSTEWNDDVTSSTHQEAEALSLKLEALKHNLVMFECMLQGRQTKEQDLRRVSSDPDTEMDEHCNNSSVQGLLAPVKVKLNRQDSLQKQRELEMELHEQKDLTKYIALHGERLWQQYHQEEDLTTHQSPAGTPCSLSQSTIESAKKALAVTDSPAKPSSSKDQTRSRWQHLQKELSCKAKVLEDLREQNNEVQITVVTSGLSGASRLFASAVRTSSVEKLRTSLVQLEELDEEAGVIQSQVNVSEETCLELEQKLQNTIYGINQCLSNTEELLYGSHVLSSEDAKLELDQQESFSKALENLCTEINNRKEPLLKAIRYISGDADIVSECMEGVQTWLTMVQAAVSSRNKSIEAELNQITSCQAETRQLHATLVEKSSTLQQALNEAGEESLDERLQRMDVLESELKEQENQLGALRDHWEHLQKKTNLTQELYKSEDVLDSAWCILKARREEAEHSRFTESQYKGLLHGLANLVEAGQEKLRDNQKLLTESKTSLQSHLQKHKELFHNLDNHVILVERFSRRMPAFLLRQNEKFWLEQVKMAASVKQAAVRYGTHLEGILQDWTEFDANYCALTKDLETLGSTLPSVGLVEESQDKLTERIAIYQQIKNSLDEKQLKVYQTVKEGKKLQTAVSSPEVEAQISKLEEQWLSVTKKVNHDLHRMESLKKHLVCFTKNSDALSNWLESAAHRLKYWKQQSLSVPQDLETVRNHLNCFLEYSKEVDDKSSLKTLAVSTGNQLLRLKEVDTATIRARLVQFEEEWSDILTQLPVIQKKLHQLQMEKLASRQSITELMTWIDNLNELMKGDEEKLSTECGTAEVTELLQKYKKYKTEMNFHQLTVDFVNQSVLQLSSQDIEKSRYDKTEFAEKLGDLNLQWQLIQGKLSKKIQQLEYFQELWTEKESKVQSLKSWLEAQQDRLRRLQKPACLITAETALLDCQELEEQLNKKVRAIEELKQSHLPEGEEVPASSDFVNQVDDLNRSCMSLANQAAQLKDSLQSKSQQWKAYTETCEEVNTNCLHAQYSLEHCKSLQCSLEAVRLKVENLQSLQEELETSEGSWQKLNSLFNTLKKENNSLFSLELIQQKHSAAFLRWTAVNQDVNNELCSAQSLHQLWQKYMKVFGDIVGRMEKHAEECSVFLSERSVADSQVEALKKKLQYVEKLQNANNDILKDFTQETELLKSLLQHIDKSATTIIYSERKRHSQRLSVIGNLLSVKSSDLQSELEKHDEFNKCLATVEDHVNDSKSVLEQLYSQHSEERDTEQIKIYTLQLNALSPDIQYLNDLSFKHPISDVAVKRVQSLNRQWEQTLARAIERCSELQGHQLQNKSFAQKCEIWMGFLEKIEGCLTMDIAGCYQELQNQQKTYEVFQTEISIGHQILNCVIREALHLFERGEVDNRSEFILKLTMLKEHWHGVTRRIWQRKSVIEGLLKQWQHFNKSLEKLTKFLFVTKDQLGFADSQNALSLQQMRKVLEDIKHKDILLQRQQCTYFTTQEAGKYLFSMADTETETFLEKELSQLQENWEETQFLLKEKKLLGGVVESWETWETKLSELVPKLQDIKLRMSEPLPELHDELQEAEKQTKELEASLFNWVQHLTELGTMKEDLSQCIIAEDAVILKEQIELLNRQWEELCLRVSLRKQEIADRLNTWIVFNDKNKELCEWLTQMENKVTQNPDLSTEEMMEKLQKDCMEEINQFSTNKVHLKQLGEQLIKASSKTQATEIDKKLNKINDRWQHLFEHIGARVKKLKDTLVIVQQLDKSMSNLRTWLARIESELSKPVIYDICDNQEIQKKLAEQQDLQRDIEQHSCGVTSVLNICDVLLHDPDACTTETECDSIQQTTRSLDRRWRNICAMSMERRMRIEETWRLWQKFLDDYFRFEDWLKNAERTAAFPNSSEVLYTNAKEELKKFEAFQRQIHERLTQLELINKQYRRLARENRTDSASKLKQMVHEGNQRWDNLQKRVAAVQRRLKHFTNQREEFEGTRESILVWLTEMDLQLTNVEHFSESDVSDKMRQLNAFQQEITLNTNKIDQLIVFGEQLIQKSEPMDAVLIEDELEELHSYCQEVFGRVDRFHQRLISKRPVSEDDTDMEDSGEIQVMSWHEPVTSEISSAQPSLHHLMPPAPSHERSGRETPVSVDSIPLEWDHTVDVGGSSSHEDEEEGTYYSALSDVEITEHPEAYVKKTTKTLKAASGKSCSEPQSWHSPDGQERRKHHYKESEVIENVSATIPNTSTPYKPGYVKLLSECSGSIDNIKRVADILNSESQDDQEGLVALETPEKQSGVIERWELIQAQALKNELIIKQNLQKWQQLNSDFNNITSWLDAIEPELEDLKQLEPATNIQTIECKIKKLKDTQKAFDKYKAVVISVNLSSKDFQQSDSVESKELQDKLRQMNRRWDQACHSLDAWKESLQHALMQCQEFHETSHTLLLWLASAEDRRCKAKLREPNVEPHVLLEHERDLKRLKQELLERQRQVNSLQELSSHLFVQAGGEDYTEAKEKVHVIGNKLKLLLRQTSQDLKGIQEKMETGRPLASVHELDSGAVGLLSKTSTPILQKKANVQRVGASQEDRDAMQPAAAAQERSRPGSFFHRVLRAALPLQFLLFLLLALACLIPFTEEDYSCTSANNFARSFYPMLKYTNGPPPT
ncbi:nesprin-2 [Latimeria chalumnae]|uniref:nesprin-2 n=1 Tax=Latimeria chalumnae TaxID=7897 RepID=UPI00313BCA99